MLAMRSARGIVRRADEGILFSVMGWSSLALVVFALPAATSPAVPKPAPLVPKLEKRIARFHGELGLAAVNLDTGETLSVRGDKRFPTASLIKVAVMVEVFHQMNEGKLQKDTIVTLRDADKAGDEAVPLNMLHDGTPLAVGDLLHLMIAYSDNTATNLLVRLVGTANVDRRMAGYGLTNTKIFRPTFRDGHADVFPEEEREFGLGMTTPREIATLLQLIAEGKIVSRAACDEMLRLLEEQQDRAMIPRSLPVERDKIEVGNKTGWDEEKLSDAKGFKGQIRTDAAYVKSPRARYVIAICVRRGKDKRATVDNEALVTGADLSRMVYDYFTAAGSPRRQQ
jgi:beta-lactamase class A